MLIDLGRTSLADAVAWFGEGWEIAPEDCGLHDPKVATLMQLDPEKVVLRTARLPWEEALKHRTRLGRLSRKRNVLRLDIRCLMVLIKNQAVPASWPRLSADGDPTHIYFDGVILKSKHDGRLYFPYAWYNQSTNLWEKSFIGIANASEFPSATLSV